MVAVPVPRHSRRFARRDALAQRNPDTEYQEIYRQLATLEFPWDIYQALVASDPPLGPEVDAAVQRRDLHRQPDETSGHHETTPRKPRCPHCGSPHTPPHPIGTVVWWSGSTVPTVFHSPSVAAWNGPGLAEP